MNELNIAQLISEYQHNEGQMGPSALLDLIQAVESSYNVTVSSNDIIAGSYQDVCPLHHADVLFTAATIRNVDMKSIFHLAQLPDVKSRLTAASLFADIIVGAGLTRRTLLFYAILSEDMKASFMELLYGALLSNHLKYQVEGEDSFITALTEGGE